MGPNNVLLGDTDGGIDLPQAPTQDLAQEDRKRASFAKSAEYQELVKHFQSRIEYYQTFLPDGRPISSAEFPTAEDWRVANLVILELKTIMMKYDMSVQIVTELDNA